MHLGPLDAATVYVIAVMFVATVVRSTLGFGEALVSVPLLALRIPVAVAAPLAVLVSVIVAGVIVAQDWRRIEFRSAAGLIIASLFGIPLGILVLARVEDHVVKLILGAIIALFSIYSLTAERRFRATLQGYFLPASVAGLVGYASIGLWTSDVTRYFVLSLPGIVVAIVIGRILNHRLEGDGFFRVVYGGLLVIGGVLVVQALAA